MKRVKIKEGNNPLFAKCWNLYNLAFPEIERRPLDYHLEAMKIDAFNFEAILDDNSSLLSDESTLQRGEFTLLSDELSLIESDDRLVNDNNLLIKSNLSNNNCLNVDTLIINSFIGFISWWEFDDIIYIEHFAVDNTLRGGGYGKKILNSFMQEFSKPIILEVEHPLEPIQQRRINFYAREGFILNLYNYSQPPYNVEYDEFLELLIMSYPAAISQNELDNFVSTKLPLIHFRYNFNKVK